VSELEEMAFHTWPAEFVEDLSGWRIRYLAGITRRGNSTWTNAWTGETSLEQAVLHVERFYAARGLAPRFYLTPRTAPAKLDTFLTERGYTLDAPVFVQTARLNTLRAAGASWAEGVRVSVAREPRAEWFALAGASSRFAEVQDVYRGLLDRLFGRAYFALATVGDTPAATALGVLDRGWLGVSSMLTQPNYRGRRLAQSLLVALANASSAQGAEGLYLIVEQNNPSALRCYARAGFVSSHEAHYRVLETDSSASSA
jgi:GNAT superfamily N-acetyltransferase